MAHANLKDISGQVFGRLEVLYLAGRNKNKRTVWRVKCSCGNELDVLGYSLTSGNTASCGCLQKEKANKNMSLLHIKQWSDPNFVQFKKDDMKEKFTVHGARCRKNPNPIYDSWHAMIGRCNSISSYLRKEIKVCDEWRHSFPTFERWALENGYEKGKHLDRKSNVGDYEPSNCQFLTEKEHRNKTGIEMKAYHAERRISNE